MKKRNRNLPIVSEGNSKLGSIDNISLTPCASCPVDAPCKKSGKCYAINPYLRHKHVKAAWDHNFELVKRDPDAFFDGLNHYLNWHKNGRFFRWHVGGGIPDQGYLDRMKGLCRETSHYKHLCFTKHHGLNFRGRPKNLEIVFSMWCDENGPWGDTKKNFPRAWLYDPKYPDPRIPSDALECPGGCENCGMCWNLREIGKDVVFHKHR